MGRALPAVGTRRLPDVAFHEVLPRPRWLQLLAATDVFLSPTAFESFGMALVEAAAAGTAIVTTSGPGMEHLGEPLTEGVHTLCADNRLPPQERAAVLAGHVHRLVVDKDLRLGMQAANRRLTEQGPLSTAERDRRLLGWYARFDTYRADPESPILPLDLSWRTFSSDAMRELDRRYARGRPRRMLVA